MIKKVGILVLQKLSSHLLTSEINDNLNLFDEEKNHVEKRLELPGLQSI